MTLQAVTERAPTCVGAGGAAEVREPVGTPQHKRLVISKPLRKQLLDVVHVAHPGSAHLECVEARVPAPKFCRATIAHVSALDSFPSYFCLYLKDLTPQ